MIAEQAEQAPQETMQPQQEAQQEQGSLIDQAPQELQEGEYFLAEGVKGIGEAEDWYKKDKYKTVADQAKAYAELEKKLGGHTGAPKDGYQLPEGFEADDDLVKEAMERAAKHGINQDAFNDILELAATQAGVTEDVSRENEMRKLGDKAAERIKQVESFLQNKAGEYYEEIAPLVKDADSIKLVESIMKAVAPPKLPIDGHVDPTGLSYADIEAEMFKTTDDGRLLRAVSPEHEAKIQDMLRRYGGETTSSPVVRL